MEITRKYIALDTETGGVDDVHSLLDIYFAVLNEDYIPVGQLSMKLKPDDGNYVVCGEAMKVNHIDLIAHDSDENTLTLKQAGPKLYEFLNEHSFGGKVKLIPIGHNVGYDLDRCYRDLVNRRTMQKFVAYRALDTCVIAQFLQGVGVLPISMTASLEALAKYFEIVNPAPHTARGDVATTVLVLRKMNDLVKALKVPVVTA